MGHEGCVCGGGHEGLRKVRKVRKMSDKSENQVKKVAHDQPPCHFSLQPQLRGIV